MPLGVIFAATTEEAELLIADSSLMEYYPSIEAKDISINHFTAIHRILDAETRSSTPGLHSSGCTTLSGELAELIANIHDDDSHTIAAQWSPCPEFTSIEWSAADVTEFLNRIIELARLVRNERKLLHIRPHY